MIEIKHKDTGAVLHRVNADTLIEEDLSRANLVGADLWDQDLFRANLAGADLSEATLGGTVLYEADLSGAKLQGAYLNGATLCGANLAGADLSGAHLIRADLSEADLTSAVLSETHLLAADFDSTKVAGAAFGGASAGGTRFTQCETLCAADGLETVRHVGSSSLDQTTLRHCIHGLPDVFLRGCGYTNHEIGYLRSLYAGDAIQYVSCFISYAQADAEFTQRLHNDLEAQNVACWMDTYDMTGGRLWREQIDEAIRVHDKLILVCSGTSLVRDAVAQEIILAIRAADKSGQHKLFPLRIDNQVFSDDVARTSKEKFYRGEWKIDWVHRVRAYHVPDFSGWKDHDTYRREFDKLLRDLKQSAAR